MGSTPIQCFTLWTAQSCSLCPQPTLVMIKFYVVCESKIYIAATCMTKVFLKDICCCASRNSMVVTNLSFSVPTSLQLVSTLGFSELLLA